MTSQCRIGEYVVIPAHKRGAGSGKTQVGRNTYDKMLFDYNAVRIAAIGNASKVHVWRVIGEGHVRTELLESILALVAVTVGVNHATDCSNIAWLEFGNCRADLGNTADDLMSRNAWIDSGHRTPLATDGVEVRVADTAEKDFNLNVMFVWVAPRDHGGGKWRVCTSSSVGLGFILAT